MSGSLSALGKLFPRDRFFEKLFFDFGKGPIGNPVRFKRGKIIDLSSKMKKRKTHQGSDAGRYQEKCNQHFKE